jgi:hypothetical protein
LDTFTFFNVSALSKLWFLKPWQRFIVVPKPDILTMKTLTVLSALLFSLAVKAQQPHKMVYGTTPNSAGMMDASKVNAFMGNKPRVSTTLKGKVLKVTKTKGGWFELAAGNGKMIDAHFKSYDVTIPTSLAGHYVIAEGVVSKQFVADDKQPLAGQTKPQQKDMPSQNLSFEVTGLEVE